MSEPSQPSSVAFLDGVAASVLAALAALDRHEAALTDFPVPDGDRTRSEALGRLEENLAGWQGILGEMAERVRSAQDELSALDDDLRRSLDAFAAARKHLQGV